MSHKESLFEVIWEIARHIPPGRVTTYGAIARCLGDTKSARLVGWAMNASHHAHPPVPAHRVVNKNGLLTGRHHFNSPTEMEELLRKENIQVVNNKIVNFEQHFWDPFHELTL